MWVGIAYFLDAREKNRARYWQDKVHKTDICHRTEEKFSLGGILSKTHAFSFLNSRKFKIWMCEISSNIRYTNASATNWSTKGAESIIFFRKLRPSISCAASDATQLAQAFKAYWRSKLPERKWLTQLIWCWMQAFSMLAAFYNSKFLRDFVCWLSKNYLYSTWSETIVEVMH